MRRVLLNIFPCLFLLLGFILPLYGAEDDTCTDAGCATQASNQQVKQLGEDKTLSYSEFLALRDSGEKFILVDVRSFDSYEFGHIGGAISFPLKEIVAKEATKRFSKSDKIVVYCGSASCPASAAAAMKLKELGFDVLDYKGGVKEWIDKGNTLVKN